VEFQTPAAIEKRYGRVTEMLGAGTHQQPAGTVTDDTEMALCLARSLVATGGFDGADVARRFVEWYDSGPFDIGVMTADALRRIAEGSSWEEAGRFVWEHRIEGNNAGNGSVMRCAPNALAYSDHPEALCRISRASSAITHADPRCTAGCATLNTVVRLLVHGADPATVVDTALQTVDETGFVPDELWTRLAGLPEATDPTALGYNGYVLATLETGLYHALDATSFEEAVVEAVNHGDDADTVGAVTGAIAGARFGAEAVPSRWSDELDERSELCALADDLLDLDPA
jgi:ADP-ribosyl-[dinitrogen reductase] hydrolase